MPVWPYCFDHFSQLVTTFGGREWAVTHGPGDLYGDVPVCAAACPATGTGSLTSARPVPTRRKWPVALGTTSLTLRPTFEPCIQL